MTHKNITKRYLWRLLKRTKKEFDSEVVYIDRVRLKPYLNFKLITSHFNKQVPHRKVSNFIRVKVPSCPKRKHIVLRPGPIKGVCAQLTPGAVRGLNMPCNI